MKVEIDDLTVAYGPGLPALEGFGLRMGPADAVALVGPSGAGKSTVALASLGLLPDGVIRSGTVRIDDVDLLRAGDADRARIRGWRVGWVGQSPSAALNPGRRVGDQVIEAVAWRRRLGRAARRVLAETRLAEVGLEARIADAWPHELSGGQQRRVVIAMALATDPAVLVADEPAASVDPLGRAQIRTLLAGIRARRSLALLLITHDLDLAAALCNRRIVLYAGRIIEDDSRPPWRSRHPYTAAAEAAVARRSVEQRGEVGLTSTWTQGCAYRPHCPHAASACDQVPPLVDGVRCVRPGPGAVGYGNSQRMPTVAPPSTNDTAGPEPSRKA